MKKRDAIVTAVLCLFVPFYSLYWAVSTKNEMNSNYGTKVPTGWVLLIPVIGFFWFTFSWVGAAAKVHGKFSPVIGWLLFCVPGVGQGLGPFLHQGGFNEAAQRGGGAPGMAMQAR